jgi:cephalosporin hydroxylase
MNLLNRYKGVCNSPSDIYLHLPRFADLVRSLQAKHVIELGTRTGTSTIAWLYGLESTGGRLTSVDISPKPDIGDFENWTFLRGKDLDPDILARIEPAEIVFIDTSHEYMHTASELASYVDFVLPGGAIVMHDTSLRWAPNFKGEGPEYPVRTAMLEFCKARGYEHELVEECNGLGIVRIP